MAAPPVHEFLRLDRCTHDRGAALLSRPLIGCLAPDALSAAMRRLGGPVPIGGADGKKGALDMEVKAFAGIDVGKAAHMCCIVDAVGNVLAGSFPFANDAEGFSKLLAELRKAGRPILVGMEATGHYGEALKRFLAANGVPYAEYNPAVVLSFAKSRGTHHKKTDRADAAAIAAFASSSPPSATTTSYHPNGLKCLVRHRRSLVVRRAACWNRVAKSLDVVFPEFVGFLGKGDASAGRKALKSAWVLQLLRKCPSARKAASMPESVEKSLYRPSRGSMNALRAAELREVAKRSVGVPSKAESSVLKSVIREIRFLDSEIAATEEAIEAEMAESGDPMLGIRGVGPRLAAAIAAEVGDFSRFDDPDKLVSYAGLFPYHRQSGSMDYTGHMAKRSSPFLRYAVMQAAMMVCLHEPRFAEIYQRKLKEGKAPLVARSHVAKRLLRIVWALETRGLAFDPSKI